MKLESRTTKGIRNIKISLVLFVSVTALSFLLRKVFIDRLSIEVMGMNTTISNILGFLNLAELGIGTAIASSLYKPVFQGNREQINDIISIQGYLYRNIALLVIGAATVLSVFLPQFFENITFPLWYLYATYFVMLFSTMTGYFFNYKENVILAYQDNYKIDTIVNGCRIIKIIAQIIAISYFPYPYFFWALCEFINASVITYLIHYRVKVEYSWLISTVNRGRKMTKHYAEVTLKVKQMFAHKLGYFALVQLNPIFVFYFSSLAVVGMYNNYLLIVNNVIALMNTVFNSLISGIGHLVQESEEKSKLLFLEINAASTYIGCVICFLFYFYVNIIISHWLGSEFILNQGVVVMLTFYLFISITRQVDVFITAYGMFSDIYAPLIETLINIVFSMVLGYFFGITGVVAGVTISLIAVVFFWKTYFLFSRKFKHGLYRFFVYFFSRCIIAVILAQLIMSLSIETFFFHGQNLSVKIGVASINIAFFGIILFIIFFIIDQSFKRFVYRFIKIIKKRTL